AKRVVFRCSTHRRAAGAAALVRDRCPVPFRRRWPAAGAHLWWPDHPHRVRVPHWLPAGRAALAELPIPGPGPPPAALAGLEPARARLQDDRRPPLRAALLPAPPGLPAARLRGIS